MKKPRNRKKLEETIIKAKTAEKKAKAYYNLGVFHDNNSREIEAIPHYERAIKLGFDQQTKAKALAWLASSLYKTDNSAKGFKKVKESLALTTDEKLKKFLLGLRQRIKRKL